MNQITLSNQVSKWSIGTYIPQLSVVCDYVRQMKAIRPVPVCSAGLIPLTWLCYEGANKNNYTLPEKLEQLNQRMAYTDDKINRLVYELYGLSEDEIVEGDSVS